MAAINGGYLWCPKNHFRIKFSMQKVYFRKVIFNVDPILNVLNALKNSNR